jgi:hypothetical protein
MGRFDQVDRQGMNVKKLFVNLIKYYKRRVILEMS